HEVVSCLSASMYSERAAQKYLQSDARTIYRSDVPAKSAGFIDMADGGSSVGSTPKWVLGTLPICSSSVPPLTISAWRSQTSFSGFPLSRIASMYLLSFELSRQTMRKDFPLCKRIVIRSKTGLPRS